ncbi:hypothetical protein [Streptomyces sp. NPDC005336]|uniref:hypothetical protein n=1 Tax=unclassified Streptomyces TaxID=2593676 RepID=UPI0033B622ED
MASRPCPKGTIDEKLQVPPPYPHLSLASALALSGVAACGSDTDDSAGGKTRITAAKGEWSAAPSSHC